MPFQSSVNCYKGALNLRSAGQTAVGGSFGQDFLVGFRFVGLLF